jgi:hypothetical protein
VTVADLKARLHRAVAGADAQHGEEARDRRFVAAIDALPDTSGLASLAPEFRHVIESGLAKCVDYASAKADRRG